jgi:hypothetical protein
VTLFIETPAPCASGHLGELAGGQGCSTGTSVLREAVHNYGASGHIDAKRERLSGEDHLEKTLGEESFYRLSKSWNHAGVVCGDTSFELLNPIVITKGIEFVVSKHLDLTFDNGPDAISIGALREANTVTK